MKLQDILSSKGQAIYSISPTNTLGEVVDKLVQHNCGALLVLEGEDLVGIISERDVLRACADLNHPLAVTVEERMTKDLITGAPDDDLEHVMGLLTQHRIRHLPVIDATKRLVGVISIGDVVKSQHEELSDENRLLKQYIQG